MPSSANDSSSNTNDASTSTSSGTTTRKRPANEDIILWSRVLERRKRLCAHLDESAIDEILEQQEGGPTSAAEETATGPDRLAAVLTSRFEQASDQRVPHNIRRTSLENLQQLLRKVDHAVHQQLEQLSPILTLPNNGTSTLQSSDQQCQTSAGRPSSSSENRETDTYNKRRPSIHIQMPNSTSAGSASSATATTTTTATNNVSHRGQGGAPTAPPVQPESSNITNSKKRSGSTTPPNLSDFLGKVHRTNQALDFAASTNSTSRPEPVSRSAPVTSTLSVSSRRDSESRSSSHLSAMNGAPPPIYTQASEVAAAARNAPVPGKRHSASTVAGDAATATASGIGRSSLVTNQRLGTDRNTPASAMASQTSSSHRGSSTSVPRSEPTGQTASHLPNGGSDRSLPSRLNAIAGSSTSRGSYGATGATSTAGEASDVPNAETTRPRERTGSTAATSSSRQSSTVAATSRNTSVQSSSEVRPKPSPPRIERPAISTDTTTVVFAADSANSQYSGSLDARHTTTVTFRKRLLTKDKARAMGNRLIVWDPFWGTIVPAVEGLTSPIDTPQPLSEGGLETAATAVIRLSPEIISVISSWGKQEKWKHGDFRLILRMLPATVCLKKRADCHLWPKGTFLTVNRTPVHIIQRKQQSHAPTQWYGMCEPLDLTPKLEDPTQPVTVEMCCRDAEQFFFIVSLCRYQSAASIVNMLIRDSTSSTQRTYLQRLSLEESKDKALQRINQEMIVLDSDDENNGQEDVGKFVFSLTCPISKRLMKVPVRGRGCKHWQCFDLETFISYNETVSGGRWRCASCESFLSHQSLQVCGLTADALERFQSEASPIVRDRVEFSSDKTYRLLEARQQRNNRRHGGPASSNGGMEQVTSGGVSSNRTQQITEIIID